METMTDVVGRIILEMSIPSAIFGMFIWYLKRRIDKNDKVRAEREKNQEDLILQMLKSNRANSSLCMAIARAVQRIPDAHCNGDMTKAIEHAEKVNKEEKEFLTELGVKHIFE